MSHSMSHFSRNPSHLRHPSQLGYDMTEDTNIDEQLRALQPSSHTAMAPIVPSEALELSDSPSDSAYETAESRPRTASPVPRKPKRVRVKPEPELPMFTVEKPELTAGYVNNNRLFRGNPNYVEFYNRHVEETLNPIPNSKRDMRLLGSKVTNDGIIYYHSYTSKPGSVWSVVEKDNFFRALALYSIHRVDLIQEHVPTKSQAEILTYYDMLRRELHHRKYGRNRARYFKYKHRGRKSIRLPKYAHGLLRYDEMPIAYEMSEEFIKFEEEQSEPISFKERMRLNDTARHFNKSWHAYTKVHDAHLIDHQHMDDIAAKVHWQQNVVDRQGGPKLAPKLHIRSLAFFEELATIVTKRIVLRATERKMLRLTDSVLVTRSDIVAAVKLLGYVQPEHRFNWNRYWADVHRRLKVNVVDDMTNGRTMPPGEVEQYFLNHANYEANYFPWVKLQSDWEVFGPGFTVENPFLGLAHGISAEANEANSPTVVDVDSLHRNQFRARQRKVMDALSEGRTKEYEMIQEHLNREEELRLEKSDYNDSRVHERALATYLMTHNNLHTTGRVYTEEEAAIVLEVWRLEEEERQFYLEQTRKEQAELTAQYEDIRRQALERVQPGKETVEEPVIEASESELDMSESELDANESELDTSGSELEEAPLAAVQEDTPAIKLSRGLVNYFKHTFADYGEPDLT
ncbi:uncharacterized protein CANTADRAFT_25610 [Suhomyces tanzawaensis NRRL Y-17324]|uniref:Myb-like domain-containing protein n=1 Tax=Suhomyces tanzawaensis NRRL Y-17324 TaxID=984487 RepID=A0A1E4SJP2_9ASCO|nr:uncharacterized protein CANTADRAFT_25610 [Suhomyces tanzawaensis NRRL Y-17324]ODV79726.1 hypothetical protein CANTADRAFT_25610 [Suhomyces tanzawaensis NRRL Y-17324]